MRRPLLILIGGATGLLALLLALTALWLFRQLPSPLGEATSPQSLPAPTPGASLQPTDIPAPLSDTAPSAPEPFAPLLYDDFSQITSGGNVVNLTNTDDDHEDIPAWSPNGDMIAFVRNPKSNSNDRQIFVMQADGSEVRQMTTLPGPNSNPIWLDATTMVFIHQPSEALRQPYVLRLSGELRQLSANEGRVWFISRVDLPQ